MKSVRRRSGRVVACFVLFISSMSGSAAFSAIGEFEGIGSLSLSDLLLEPTYRFTEPHRGDFSVGSSFLAATWTRDRYVSGVFKIGSKELLGQPARYGTPVSTELGLVEVFAQVESDFGRLRFGLVPIPFGLEGGDSERRLRFPRSLVFQARFINIRDFGLSYRIANDGFFSDWAIHNGEGSTDLDNESWFTARWGWQGLRFVRLGVSGSAGRTSPRSTNALGTSLSSAAGLDVNKIAKIAIANGFISWEAKPVRLEVEATAGDTRQEDNVIKYRQLHADLSVEGGSSTLWLARYDTVDPRNDASGDQATEFTAGVAWRSRYENSVFYILATKRVQQDVAQDVHRALILWRITPTAVAIQAPL